MVGRLLAFAAAFALCSAADAQTPRPDVMRGADLPETLRGEAADDVISAGAGHDEIYGGGGDDIIRAGLGRDAVSGGSGADLVFGDDGNDTLHGGDGHDIIEGGPGGDLIHGDAGSDYLYGGDGDDYLNGGPGIDWLFGGAGADHFMFAAADLAIGESDVIADFNRADGDRIDLSGVDGDAAFAIVPAFTRTSRELTITTTGRTFLEFDVDGNGVADGAIVVTATDVSATDIDL